MVSQVGSLVLVLSTRTHKSPCLNLLSFAECFLPSNAQMIQQRNQCIHLTEWSGVSSDLHCPRHASVAMLRHLGSMQYLPCILDNIISMISEHLRCGRSQ
eukprot:s699_g10.t1